MRIYWRYNESKKTAGADEEGDLDMADNTSISAVAARKAAALKPPEHKGYYLFSSTKVEQVLRHDYAKIRKNINRRLYEH